MSLFTPLNVEPEEDVQEEVDDSKEIQVEEALKLYQTALKLHVQGPGYYEEAEEAYDALFASEIFKYPESQSEAKRLAQLNDLDESDVEDADNFEGPPPPAGIEAAPNTLPQLLYLSYKNHGQFLVDRVAHHIAIEKEQNPEFVFEYDKDAREAAREPLDFFVEALDRDETDSDLWRRTARICRLLGSRRLLRFCTEAALVSESADGDIEADAQGIESVFAKAELGSVLEEIEDDLSKLTLQSLLQKARQLSKMKRQIMDPFPNLPEPTVEREPPNNIASKQRTLNVSDRSWTAIGKAILGSRKHDVSLGAKLPFANSCELVVPAKRPSTESADTKSPQKLVTAESLTKERTETEVDVEGSEKLKSNEEGNTEGSGSPKKVSIDPETNAPSTEAPQTSVGEEATITSPTEEKGETPAPKSRRASSVHGTLKRNSESAGLGEGGEQGRSRSKRLRARQETSVAIEEDVDPEEQRKQFEKQLAQHVSYDEWLFKIVNVFCSRMDIHSVGTYDSFRRTLAGETKEGVSDSNGLLKTVIVDFKDALGSWDLNKSNLLLHGRGSGASVTLISATDDSGLASFLEHSKPNTQLQSDQTLLSDQGISEFAEDVNSEWNDAEQLGLKYIEYLLNPRSQNAGEQDPYPHSTYTAYIWPISLKETLCQLIVEEDENLFPMLQKRVFERDGRECEGPGAEPDATPADDYALMHFVQAIFELHLDIYGKITNASSKVDQPTRTLQRDRAKRWAGLTSQTISSRVDIKDEIPSLRNLAYRYLWSTVIYVSLVDPSSRDHVLVCLRDLKRLLQDENALPFSLPNNGVMPEISIEAAEREITRLTTMDFFLSIFDPTTEDATATIESLEPILMEVAAQKRSATGPEESSETPANDDKEGSPSGYHSNGNSTPQVLLTRNEKLAEFLGKASASLRLSLWHRLKAAYQEIEYPPMVLLCNVQSLVIVLDELKGTRYSNEAKEDRSANLFVWVRNISDILTSSLDLIKRERSSLDSMDETHLPVALTVISDITKLLHTFAFWEDSVRIGQCHAPPQASGGANPYKSAMNHLRELQPKCWTMLYHLLKEATIQYAEIHTESSNDLAEYLAAVHNAFSLREYCRLGKKAFLKMMKTELIVLEPPGDWSLDLAQVVYDLYGLKIYAKPAWIIEHGCNADQIDRGSALELIEPFMAQANVMNIRDVLRSDMRIASEKMQAVIGTPRSSSSTSSSAHQAFNRRLLLAYLKAPINPVDIYKSLKGIGSLEVMPVVTDYAAIANKKWFFLQGHLLLAKYQAQKRATPGDDEDLDKAVNFFKLDLDFDAEGWESWYRLAQTYDAKIDESITWDSKDINNPESELVSLQKSSVHCYTMAVAVAIRHADDSKSTLAKISDLYADFAIRLYASSRSPLSMKAFSIADFERFYNSETRGTYKKDPFTEMSETALWKLASVLFRKALKAKPEAWANWYMLGKCLWKLYGASDHATADTTELLEAFSKAADHVPLKRDSKHPDKEPILEPHYKLIAIAYKLMKQGRLDFDGIEKLLQHSSHTKKIKRADHEDPKSYVLQALKVLRAADKSNWHHRMVARAAHIHYDDNPSNNENAEAAKRELTQQIFTKTLAIQVWRPEYERPGRHFVYKTNYTRFFARILGQLGDRTNVDALAKRIRKKQNEFVAHTDLWTDVVTVYLQLLRDHGKIPENYAEVVFKSDLTFQRFALNAGRLEGWAHSEASQGDSTIDLLRELMELRRLSGVYIKPGIIDDLVEDTYSYIYEQHVPELEQKADEAENRDRMRIDRMLFTTEPDPEPEPTATTEGTTATGRPKTIGRGEIRRRAEALVARLMAPSQGRRGRREPKSPTASRGGFRPTGGEDGGKEGAPSINDDADDESDLSEPPADDDEGEGEGGGDGDGDDDGEGDGDGDGEGDGDGDGDGEGDEGDGEGEGDEGEDDEGEEEGEGEGEEDEEEKPRLLFPGVMRQAIRAESTVDGTEDEDMATADEDETMEDTPQAEEGKASGQLAKQESSGGPAAGSTSAAEKLKK